MGKYYVIESNYLIAAIQFCNNFNGFINGYQRDPDRPEYLKAAAAQLDFIFQYCVDPREGSEWFEIVDRDGVPYDKPMVQPWKCPYHNGRMCMEIIRRGIDTES